jgi:acetate kinase
VGQAAPAWLILNSGSSSLKFAVYAAGSLERLNGGKINGIDTSAAQAQWSSHKESVALGPVDHAQALDELLERLQAEQRATNLTAVTHRVVHGGECFHATVRIDEQVHRQLAELIPLAPLHQPPTLAAIDRIAQWRPGIAQFACFDTAFHHGQPAPAREFALPRKLTDDGILRYGFHGLSYEYVASVLPDKAVRMPDKCIIAHLGNGASLCALQAGRSIATSMSFTPLDGIPMGTRPGQLDPGVVLYLQKVNGMSVEQVEDLLYRQSGLLGMSGISADVQQLLESSEPAATAALQHFVYRIGREIGSLAAPGIHRRYRRACRSDSRRRLRTGRLAGHSIRSGRQSPARDDSSPAR